jgi:hypothetical protein
MQRATNDTPAVFSVILIVSALHWAVGRTAIAAPPADPEQAIAAIERCIEQAPSPWPDNWRSEYTDTIRQAIGADPNSLPAPWHMEALTRAFEPYWQALAKDRDRPSFEVQQAEIRWYVENLVSLPAPSEPARRQLHDQYQALWDHAAGALLAQFPFLDPNAVRAAQADHLAHCRLYIDAPLVPLFVHPLTPENVEAVKKRWHDLRYDRVDFWRRLGGKAILTVAHPEGASLQTHPHYLLTHQSLDQWLIHIHAMTIAPPDHYLQAIRDRNEAQRRHRQALSQAWADEKRLERQYHGQLFQTEYLSFLFAALLETASQDAVPTPGGDPHAR